MNLKYHLPSMVFLLGVFCALSVNPPLRAEEKARVQALVDRAIQAAGGETKLTRLKAARKEHREVQVFFDKETGLLVKTVTRVKDNQGGGKDLNQETYYSDHKEIAGVKVPMKFTVLRDGKPFLEGEALDCNLTEKLD